MQPERRLEPDRRQVGSGHNGSDPACLPVSALMRKIHPFDVSSSLSNFPQRGRAWYTDREMEKCFPGQRHRLAADSQTVIGAFDQRRVTRWLLGRARPGNKAFPILVTVQSGPVRETGTLHFQIMLQTSFVMVVANRSSTSLLVRNHTGLPCCFRLRSSPSPAAGR